MLLIIATGVGLALMAHFPLLRTFWIAGSLVLFGISGLAFAFKVGPLQKKLLANAKAGSRGNLERGRIPRTVEVLGNLGNDCDSRAPCRGVPDGDETGRDLISFT